MNLVGLPGVSSIQEFKIMLKMQQINDYSKYYIVVFFESYRDASFYCRMVKALHELGYEYVILTNKLYIYLKYKKDYKIFLIKKSVENVDIELSHTVDFHKKFQTSDQLRSFYTSIYLTLKVIHKRYNVKILFIWGWGSVQALTFRDFAEVYNYKTIYFEISNLPGKLFVDPKGVNKNSLIFNNINILNSYKVSENDYLNWKINFAKYKRDTSKPSQAKYKYKINNYWFLLDNIGFKLFNIPSNGDRRIYNKIKSKIFFNLLRDWDEYDINKNRNNFIFFPAQVFLDSQILIFSNYSVTDGIKNAFKKSKELGLDLVVKIHPAEDNIEAYKDIINLKKKLGFYLSNISSYYLILFSNLVYTINSTVGLEAKIFGKKVNFLENNIYKLLNDELLRKYILGYLVNIDFFSKEVASNLEVRRILKRADWCEV
jgi:capsular polysaccharide export protein